MNAPMVPLFYDAVYFVGKKNIFLQNGFFYLITAYWMKIDSSWTWMPLT